jgi:hypothetical protein
VVFLSSKLLARRSDVDTGSIRALSSGKQNIDINHWTDIEIMCILMAYMTGLK